MILPQLSCAPRGAIFDMYFVYTMACIWSQPLTTVTIIVQVEETLLVFIFQFPNLQLFFITS